MRRPKKLTAARIVRAGEDVERLKRQRAQGIHAHNKGNLSSVQTIHTDGSLMVCAGLNRWQWDTAVHARGARKACTGFSKRSRRAMLLLVAKLPAEMLPLLLTLTYPREWSPDPRQWKRDLDTFGKALRREYPAACIVWKLEPQKRGAPHFHAIAYGVEWIDMNWLADSWFRIVGGTQEEHRDAGTRIERARLAHAAVAYAAKSYAAKQVDLPPGWEKVGRFWGIIGRAALPLSRTVEIRLDEKRTFAWRRILRKWGERKAIPVASDGTCNIFTRNFPLWTRVLGMIVEGKLTGELPVSHPCRFR